MAPAQDHDQSVYFLMYLSIDQLRSGPELSSAHGACSVRYLFFFQKIPKRDQTLPFSESNQDPNKIEPSSEMDKMMDYFD